MRDKKEEILDLLSLSVELGMELCKFFPDIELCNRVEDIFYDQISFVLYLMGTNQVRHEYISDELMDVITESYINDLRNIKHGIQKKDLL